MNLRQLEEGLLSEIQHVIENISVEVFVDMGNGIDNRCPLLDMIYDSRRQTFVLYVDGRNLEY